MMASANSALSRAVGALKTYDQRRSGIPGEHWLTLGLGLTLLVVPLTDVALAQTSIANAGAASGVLGTFQQVGSAIGVAVVGVVFFGIVGATFVPDVLRDAFLGGIWVPITALCLAALASFLLPSVTQVAAHKADAELAIEREAEEKSEDALPV